MKSNTKLQQKGGVKTNKTRKIIKQLGEHCGDENAMCVRGTRCLTADGKEKKTETSTCQRKDRQEEIVTRRRNIRKTKKNSKKSPTPTPAQEPEPEPTPAQEPEPTPAQEPEPEPTPAQEPEEEQEPTPVQEVERIVEESKAQEQEQEAYIPTPNETSNNNDYQELSSSDQDKYIHENYANISQEAPDYEFLYPEINDPTFQQKIAERQEFVNTKYDGELYDIKEQSENKCNAEFELLPHQLFVKNFLSPETPYNSLLLYHGLGTGKTCSAIGIAEEARVYRKQMGFDKTTFGLTGKICIVASPSVQKGFRLQLFDDRKLKFENGQWNLSTCIGNKLLQEINPNATKEMSFDKIVKSIDAIINDNYVFIGYRELANKIYKIMSFSDKSASEESINTLKESRVRKYLNNTVFIIDEFHNIRKSEDNKDKVLVDMLFDIATYSDTLRLVLLSATPLYNSPKEIVWITNLLNRIDGRSEIQISQVFDRNDNLIKDDEHKGLRLLQRKLNGYISYVRGENPYTFPHRLYPSQFVVNDDDNATFKNYINIIEDYPKYQLNGAELTDGIKHLDLYTHNIGSYQAKGYAYIMEYMKQKLVEKNDYSNFENMETFGYTFLQKPLQALNIVYPSVNLNELIEKDDYTKLSMDKLIGVEGLKSIMTNKYDKETMSNYDYEYKIKEPIFQYQHIGKYSHKIKKILDIIQQGASGIIMIYSNYLSGGIIPMALALEEMGFSKYSSSTRSKSLLSGQYKRPKIDSLTMQTKDMFIESRSFLPAQYVMITGDKSFSANNIEDLKYITSADNKDGSRVKVVLITKAAAEGLDFKNIRQVHMMEPWYNMNRMEQIIGRGVRNNSHCALPLEERNVEIYHHATTPIEGKETVDLYVYRFAEQKATKIGEVTRMMKELSVDCLLNSSQVNYTEENMNTTLDIVTSTNRYPFVFNVGDKKNSSACDYMENCQYKCMLQDNYSEKNYQYTNSLYYAKNNTLSIATRIRELFREEIYFKEETLYNLINTKHSYPEEQIDFVLQRFSGNRAEPIYDQYNRKGYLIHRNNYYLYQPYEVTDEYISLYERKVPLLYKQKETKLKVPFRVTGDSRQETLEATDDVNTQVISSQLSELEKIVDALINDTYEGDKDNWYTRSMLVKHFLYDQHNVSEDQFKQYIVDHWFDTMDWVTKRPIFEDILKKGDSNGIRKQVKNCITQHLLPSHENLYVFYDNKIKKLSIYKFTTTWELIDEALHFRYKKELDLLYKPMSKFNDIFGFHSYIKDSNLLEFKFRQKTVQGNYAGKRCGNVTIEDLYKYLNSITKKSIHNTASIKKWFSTLHTNKFNLSKKSKSVFISKDLCILLELLLRHFQQLDKDQIWYLSQELFYIHADVFSAPRKK